jgi:hypothetical protein
MPRALQLQGKAEKTVEAYARAIRRSAALFDRCPDDLAAEDLQIYYDSDDAKTTGKRSAGNVHAAFDGGAGVTLASTLAAELLLKG